MDKGMLRRTGMLALIFLGAWLGVRYLLPILLPFLLGLMFALLAEPGVKFLRSRLRFPRGVASAVAVGSGFVMIFVLAWMLGAAAYRELTVLVSTLPAFFEGISGGAERIRDWALTLVSKVPDGLAAPLRQWVTELFAGGSVLLGKVGDWAIGVAGSVMGGIPGSALMVGTTVISSFMISAQLPALKKRLRALGARQWVRKWGQALGRVKAAVGGWLKAQVKLSGITLLIVGAGLLLLRVKNVVFWAVVIALVDAVPMLGTGTILVPWCIIAFLQGDSVRAIGLLGLYLTAMLTRSALEPKLVGRHLGMNPLLTLISLYAGYRIWGVAGMIFAPILTVAAKQLTTLRE